MTTAATPETNTTSAVAPPAPPIKERYERLPLDQIVPSKTNPRTHFDAAYIAELARSIAEKGVAQPILVREAENKRGHRTGGYEIIAGECRYRASKEAKQPDIPALIRNYTDEQVLELQLVENIHRRDLSPLEQARGYRGLIDSNPTKHSAESIATRIGMSPQWVWDRMKLLDLVPDAKELLEQDRITVGHAILIARLKPEDQKRVIDPKSVNRFGGSRDGLWQHQDGALEFDTAEKERKHKPGKYDDLKPISVRELDAWIKDHVRFDVEHAVKAQPLIFEQTATKVEEATAEPGRGRKVISITHEYRVADDARDENERTYGSQSWERADGEQKSKTCEHSVLGVVVAGRGQGETFQVCVAREKCLVHWAEVVKAKQKAAKLRQQGKGKQATRVEKKQEESLDAKWKRQQAERAAREKAWKALCEHLIAEIVAQVKAMKSLSAAQAKFLTSNDFGFDRAPLEAFLGKSWYKQPVQAILLLAASLEYSEDFDDYVRNVAKPLGLNVKRLQAIRDQHQLKAESIAGAVQSSGAKSKKTAKGKAAA